MIWGLRNIALRLWIAALLTLPAGVYLMPRIMQYLPGVPPFAATLAVMGIFYCGTGFILDVSGRLLIRVLIREGEVWERAGILNKARHKYNRAVRIYDSFLLSPLSARQMAKQVTGTLARYSLTAEDGNEMFERAAAAYLMSTHRDETLAGLWLKRPARETHTGPLEQEVLTCLGNTYYANANLLPFLLQRYLDLGRLDYSAKRIYTRAMEDPDLAESFSHRIREVMGAGDRTLADGMQQQAVPESSFREAESDGDAAGRNIPAREDRPLAERIPMAESVLGPKPGSWGRLPGVDRQALAATFRQVRAVIRSVFSRAWTLAAAALSFLVLACGKGIAHIREKERAGFYAKAAAMGLLTIWLAYFAWNTASHMLKPKRVETVPPKQEAVVPKPFTIQVAAYLKQSHADRFLKVLAEKGITARVKKTGGGGKTWFLIRISEFPDKDAAAAYGNKLKAENIIDDFFVCNKD